MPKKDKNFNSTLTQIGPYMGLGTQLAATMVAMFFLGYWIDQKLNSLPIFTVIFSFLGGFASIYNFIKAVLNSNKKKQK